VQATPQSDTVSPVSVEDFAEYVGADAADPLLPGLLIAATDAAIQYMNRDLLTREWVALVKAPEPQARQLSPYNLPTLTFDLPYSGDNTTVESVAYVETLEDVEHIAKTARRPARVILTGWDYITDVEITYTTGSASVSPAIQSGIMAIGAFLYEHRGECDATDAVMKSGAANLLRPYRIEVAL
jgi:hypothetical protein